MSNSQTRIKTGGSRFDASEKNTFFTALQTNQIEAIGTSYNRFLIPANKLTTEESREEFNEWIDADENNYMLLDSGAYMFAIDYAKKNKISLEEALSTPIPELEGFDTLYNLYVSIVKAQPDLWGYIELDLGSTDDKRKTRQRLHDEGLNPIPVYHPTSDPLEYLHEIASQYDRICIGNVVSANRDWRRRLLIMLYDIQKQYPDTWIHLLGLTPNDWLNSYPVHSADSSAWMSAIRWHGVRVRAYGAIFSLCEKNFKYDSNADVDSERGHRKCLRMSVVNAFALSANWKNYMDELRDLNLMEVAHV